MSIVSAYFRDGVGITEINAALLTDACAHAANSEHAGLIGGDFQNDPSTMAATGAFVELGAVVIAPGPTCFVKARDNEVTMSTIDYFISHGNIDAAVEKAAVIKASCIKTHRVVQVDFEEAMAELRRKELKKLAALPVDRIFGPLPPSLDWDSVSIATAAARDIAFAAAEDCKTHDGTTVPLSCVPSSLVAHSALQAAMQKF